MAEVIFEGEVYTGAPLSPEEDEILARDVKLLGWSSSLLDALLQENMGRLRGALMVAKEKLSAPFKGLSASDQEIGIQLIRPSHVLRTTSGTETPANDWTFTFTADADYWLGYNTNWTTALNIDKRLCVVPLGIAFTQGGPPLVEELLLQVNSTTYPVIVLRHAWLADNLQRVRFTRIRPQLWPPATTVLGQVYSILAGDNQLVLIGVTFGKGDLLRQQAPTAVQI